MEGTGAAVPDSGRRGPAQRRRTRGQRRAARRSRTRRRRGAARTGPARRCRTRGRGEQRGRDRRYPSHAQVSAKVAGCTGRRFAQPAVDLAGAKGEEAQPPAREKARGRREGRWRRRGGFVFFEGADEGAAGRMPRDTEGQASELEGCERSRSECCTVFVSNSVFQFPRHPNGGIGDSKFQFPIPYSNANIQTQP